MLLTAQFSVDCGLVCICICISIFSVDRDLVRDQSNAAGRLKDDSRVEAGLRHCLCKNLPGGEDSSTRFLCGDF